MRHFIRNLVLLPVRLVWDIALILFTFLLTIGIYSWALDTWTGVVTVLMLLVGSPAMLLLPLCPLLALKRLWPAAPINKSRAPGRRRVRTGQKFDAIVATRLMKKSRIITPANTLKSVDAFMF